MKRMVFLWGYWGPYHYARFRGARQCAGEGFSVHGLELFRRSGIYDYTTLEGYHDIEHVNMGAHEMQFYPLGMLREALPALKRLRPDVLFVPSYWHWSLVMNLRARLRGTRIVMMNETHAGTERATGLKRWVKRQIVSRFHAGLVGGTPHRRYYASLGLDEDRIFPGYDVVDNGFFETQAAKVRADAEVARDQLALPPDFFLSLGRMVTKKNLPRLVRAFLQVAQPEGRPVHLVFVGSGDVEPELRRLCAEGGLPVVDHTRAPEAPEPQPDYDREKAAAHFYGFRQIDQNPIFYALARAFILPSLYEEWGLVVNESMASATPVIASATLGSTEDLVIPEQTGLAIDPEDESALRAALQRFADDATWARQMGQQAQTHVRGFGLEHFGNNARRAAEAALTV
ncbi:MAG: glycosyltransferase family 4 protein [Opitutales bacterium]